MLNFDALKGYSTATIIMLSSNSFVRYIGSLTPYRLKSMLILKQMDIFESMVSSIVTVYS